MQGRKREELTRSKKEEGGGAGKTLTPGDQVLVIQKKGSKLSTTFEYSPHILTNQYENEVTVKKKSLIQEKCNQSEELPENRLWTGPD